MESGDSALTDQLKTNWREATLPEPDRVLLVFAAKLTHHPAQMCASDVEVMRRHGFSDAAIHDAIQVVSYFNYINRVADATGVDAEDFMKS